MKNSPPSMDLYRILGICQEASREDINRAYKSLIRRWHPDKANPELIDYATRISQLLNIAREWLTDEENRRIYDDYFQRNYQNFKSTALDEFRLKFRNMLEDPSRRSLDSFFRCEVIDFKTINPELDEKNKIEF